MYNKLSAREKEIYSLVVNGLDNLEIAKKLWITRATAANHICSIYQKIGIRDRTKLVVDTIKI